MYKSPVFDLTTCIEVDDLFFGPGIERASAWGRKAIADFVDASVYGKSPGYFAPLKYEGQDPKSVTTCSLVEEMKSVDTLKLKPVAFEAYKPELLTEIEYRDFMERFASWLFYPEHEGLRQFNVRMWLATQERYRIGHKDRIPGGVLFPYTQFSQKSQRMLESAARRAELRPEEMEYTFDVCYRRILYEDKTPDGEHFIHHPLRDVCRTKDTTINSKSDYVVPISFRHWATTVAPTLELAEFVDTLARIKDAVHNSPIITKMNYDITRAEVRDLAFDLKLPPSLKGVYVDLLDNQILWGSTAFGVASTMFDWSKTASFIVTFGGAAVTLMANRLKKQIPEAALKSQHLKFLVTWPELEEQVIRINWDD
jgi:hypothetical protein